MKIVSVHQRPTVLSRFSLSQLVSLSDASGSQLRQQARHNHSELATARLESERRCYQPRVRLLKKSQKREQYIFNNHDRLNALKQLNITDWLAFALLSCV